MADLDIFEHINALSGEEERLYQRAGDGQGLSSDELERLRGIKVELPMLRRSLASSRAPRNATSPTCAPCRASRPSC